MQSTGCPKHYDEADFPLVRVGKNFKVSEQAFIEWSSKRRV